MSLSAENKVKNLSGMITYQEHRDETYKRGLKWKRKGKSTGYEQLKSYVQENELFKADSENAELT